MRRRLSTAVRLFVIATAVAAGGGRLAATPQAAPCGLEMRILVVSADGTEAALPAITRTLDYLGTPYTTHIGTRRPNTITPTFLFEGCRGNFQAVILTNSDVGYSKDGVWTSALSADEFAALRAYQAQFRVRQVTWYSFPTPELGLTWGIPASAPVDIAPTDAGRRVFPYLTLTQPLPIRNAFTYLARVNDTSTTPLFTDAQGHALVAVKTYPDGRENLALTFDSNPDLLHSVLLGYGIVHWATRGIFIGERRTYLSAQVDDIFLDTHQWLASMPCDTDHASVPGQVRMTGEDMRAVVAWQRARNAQPLTQRLRLTMAFNGEGSPASGDSLTTEAIAAQQLFHWVNHTWTHARLDSTDYAQSLDEIRLNVAFAQRNGLTSFSAMNLITPQITGLTNPEFLRAAVDGGVRYLVSDASRPGYDGSRPNIGIYNAIAPSLFMIPRRANNLFYNVTAPEDWAAEYNCLYRSHWGRDLTIDEILDFESQQLLMHLLRGELNPWMFHQANLVAYDGTRTLLTDLLDRTLAKYARYVNWPVESPTMEAVGAAMEARMRRYSANVSATLQPGGGVIVTSDRQVRIPITGLHSAQAHTYAGQSTTWVDVPANSPVVVAFRDQPAPGGPLPTGWSNDDVGAVGIAGAASHDATANAFSITGAGADVWGTADAFHFSYVPLDGDGRIVARVTSLQDVHAWVKAGVMIRETLYPGSAHGFMLVSARKGLAFQRRPATDGISYSTAGAFSTAPRWVRLDRAGATLTAYESVDGMSWTLVGSDTIAMGNRVYVGLAVSSHLTTATSRAAFDRVTVTGNGVTWTAPPPPSPAPAPSGLPSGWSTTDVGAVGTFGAAQYESSTHTFTVAGGGADVWGTADGLHFTYFPMDGDVSVRARVADVQNVHAWTKAGVMIRESLAAGSPHAYMLVSAGNGLSFQRRPLVNDVTYATPGAAAASPYWVRLDRFGNTIYAYQSPDGAAWTLVGTDSIPMTRRVFVGIGVSSHSTSTLANARFERLMIRGEWDAAMPAPPPPEPWQNVDVGSVGPAGSVTEGANGTVSVTGAGADIWNTADAFHYRYKRLSGDGVIIARVASVQYVANWVKAGVMIRQNLEPSSPHAFMLVSARKGVAFQRRTTSGGWSTHTAGPFAGAPYWVKLERKGSKFLAYTSSTGVTWALVGSETIAMPRDVLIGLAVSSHTTSATATAAFDNVSIR